MSSELLPRVDHPALWKLTPRLLPLVESATSAAAFWDQALQIVLPELHGGYLALARGAKGQWRVVGAAGRERPLPGEFLADVLDRDAPATRGEWSAAPLERRGQRGELLALHRPRDAAKDAAREPPSAAPRPAADADPAAALASAAQLLGQLGRQSRARFERQQRVERLEAILQVAAQWNQANDMESLLHKMAEASTRLLRAERASIFLWDRLNKTLVGRPALGVEGNELRVPDDSGVVGHVVRTGANRRVDADVAGEQREVNRDIDKQLKFHTRSLLCVPLRGAGGEIFGAFELINKIGGNFSDEDEAALVELAHHAGLALESTQEHETLVSKRQHIAEHAAAAVKLIGECPAIQALRSTVERVAKTSLTVLILGENGTGKEVVAQLIHYLSDRRQEPFVAVNCAALTETLLESELFGHERGAFTDARDTRQGKFELASGGTLFLDEIGDMSLGGQAKLLRALEEKVIVRVGGSQNIPTDARVCAATNQNLVELVRQKRFREDLFYRLNVARIELPPLRERGDDMILLAEHFLRDFCGKARRKAPHFSAAARKRMAQHSWPGNVRELRNLMERLAYLLPGDKIDADDLAFILTPEARPAGLLTLDRTLADATRDFQREYIEKHVQAARGNMTDAADHLGLHRSNLYRKMRQLGMAVEEA